MASSLGAQIALGWLLSDEDFGIYALAIGVSSFLLVFKDAGVRLWLVRQDKESFDNLLSDAFWLSLASSVLVGVALAGVSPIVGRVYGESQATTVVLVLAAAVPLGAYPGIAMTRLQVDLRFVTLARVEITSALIRYTLTVVLALLGFGPLSFALPVIVVNAYESIACRLATQLRPWRERPSLARSRVLLRRLRWPLVGSFAGATFRQSDYVALGLVATTSVVGIYYFAYQLSVRLLNLVSESLRKVVVPLFAAASSQQDRQHQAAIRGSAFIGLIAAPVFLLLTVMAEPLEQLLWQGRWSVAVPAIQILSAALPMQLFARFLEMVTVSLGGFRRWALAIAIRGVGLGAAALLSGPLGGSNNPTVVATVIGLYLFISGLAEVVFLGKRARYPTNRMISMALPPYLFSGLVAIGVLSVSGGLDGLHAFGQLSIAGAAYICICALGIILFFGSARELVAPLLRRIPVWERLVGDRRG